jgi:hypothetical protein
MKKLAVLTIAATVLSACSEATPTAIHAEDASFNGATSVAADVLGTFNVGSGTGETFEYMGNNTNILCDAHGVAWNEQSGNAVPGQSKYCVLEGMTSYTVVWSARYIDNKSTTHLNFEHDVNVKKGNKGNVVGQGVTAWADVVLVGTTTVVGQARVDLTQYTGGRFVDDAEGYACLLKTPAVTLEYVVDGVTTTPALTSLCW